MTKEIQFSRHEPALPTAKSETFLSQNALARRWDKSTRTLEAWRQRGIGPAYVKIGRSVRYRLDTIEAYEAANLHHGGRSGQR